MENLPISNSVLSFLEQTQKPTFESVSEYTDATMTKMENGLILTDKGSKYSDSTIRLYKSFLKYFEMFEGQIGKNILFSDLSHNLGSVFGSFLAEQNLTKNSISAILKKFKSILNFAFRDGISAWNGAGLKTPTEKTPKIYLTLAEIKTMKDSKMTFGQKQVMDVFIVQCFTGFRYDTLIKFLRSPLAYVKEHEGESYIDIISDKTNEQSVVPLGSTVIEVIKKYNGGMPTYSEEYINRTIKNIAKNSGIVGMIPTRITRGGQMIEELVPKYSQISTHTARRTFVSLLKQEKDVQDKEIMAMTGHKSEKQLSEYNRSSKFEIVLPILGNKFFNKEI